MTLTIIVAMDRTRGIGVQNRLPWHLPQDLAHFKRQTQGHPVIMGRKTHESIGRPLPKRRNIVITRNPQWRSDGVEAVTSLDAALQLVSPEPKVFVIGGAEIYAAALPQASHLLVTEIDQQFDCDTFFPQLEPNAWQEIKRETHHDAPWAYSFVEYQRRP